MKARHDFDSISSSVRCKICMHVERDKIEDLIKSNKNYDEIVVKFPTLNTQNVSTHWRNHMAPHIKIKAGKAIEDAAIEVKDSINELTKLFDEHDKVLQKLIKTIDPAEPDYLNKINAVRGLINAKTQMIKLNMSLVGDTKATRDSINIMAAMEAVNKQLNKEKEVQLLAEFEKANQ